MKYLNILLISMTLAGCGFKGPLYMPAKPNKPVAKKTTASNVKTTSVIPQQPSMESSNSESHNPIYLPK